MAGLFGAVSTPSDDTPATIIECLARAAKHGSWVKSRRVDTRTCSLMAHCADERISIARNSGRILAIQGEVFGISTPTAPDVTAGDSPASVDSLMSLYLSRGAPGLCGLNGTYVVAVFDETSETLSLISDRGGFSHLYYWHHGEVLVFADELPSLLAHPKISRDINLQTVGDILTVGYPLSDRTLFAAISLLPAATVLTFHRGSMSLQKYWDYEFSSDSGPVDVRDLSQKAWDAIGRSVVVRTSPRVCVPITGGLDSRTVAGALQRFTPGTSVLTDTIGPPSCIDVQYGRRIAHRLGFPHRHEELDSDYISRYGPEIVRILGGSAGCYTGWVLAQNQILLDFGRPVVMTGFLGDCLSGGHLPVAMADSTRDDEVLNHLYAHSYETVFSAEALKRLLRPELVSRIEGSAHETIARTFREAKAESPLHRCDYVDLVQRQRRFICTHIALHQPVAPVRDPFTDVDVVDFFMRLPLKSRLRQDLYVSMIKRFLPELARLPRSSDGLPLTASRPRRELSFFQNRMRKRMTEDPAGARLAR